MATIGNLRLLRARIGYTNHTNHGSRSMCSARQHLISGKQSPGQLIVFMKDSRASYGRAGAKYGLARVISTSALINDTSNLSKEIGYETSDHYSSIHEAIKESNQHLFHHFKLSLFLHMIIEVITFIWRIPGLIVGLLSKEKKLLDTVEEDIDETADVIKITAKAVEVVAQDIEKFAERVDEMMDEVKKTTKTTHDEVEEVVDTLEGSVQDVQKDVGKIQVKVKVSKDGATTTQETTNTMPSTSSSSPSPTITTTNATNTTTDTTTSPTTMTTPSPFLTIIGMIHYKHFSNLTWQKGHEILLDFVQGILHTLNGPPPFHIPEKLLQRLFMMTVLMTAVFQTFGVTSPLIFGATSPLIFGM